MRSVLLCHWLVRVSPVSELQSNTCLADGGGDGGGRAADVVAGRRGLF